MTASHLTQESCYLFLGFLGAKAASQLRIVKWLTLSETIFKKEEVRAKDRCFLFHLSILRGLLYALPKALAGSGSSGPHGYPLNRTHLYSFLVCFLPHSPLFLFLRISSQTKFLYTILHFHTLFLVCIMLRNWLRLLDLNQSRPLSHFSDLEWEFLDYE